jgi:hypothetical protein
VHAGDGGLYCSKCYIEDGVRRNHPKALAQQDFLGLARLAVREAELFESKAEYAHNKAQDKGPDYADAATRYENEARNLRMAVARLLPMITGEQKST